MVTKKIHGEGHIARTAFVVISLSMVVATIGLSIIWVNALYSLVIIGPIILLGIADMFQTEHSIRRNFPVIGHGRYLLEMIRPEINQYFVESNTDGRPFSRERRSVIYQRAKGVTDTIPFGTQQDVYAPNYEWVNHSLNPKPVLKEEPRVVIGGKDCTQKYKASLFNISAMSYGALSSNAIIALNKGAKKGGFYHNTGEGGLSPYHIQEGGDLVWQIGTGYFSCRDALGHFSESEFRKRATLPNVKMIEVKLSQGAKPGHGGILPAKKVTREIANIRSVPMGMDILSPPAHTAFSTPEGLLRFVSKLRELSDGKPIGFKLCVGKRREFLAICKAMLKTGILPDFITVDGAEGGTGAAPLEFSNSVGTPLNEAIAFVHNSLVGSGVRDQIRIIASGQVTTGFNLLSKMALGADLCNSARGMMFALGCIQALRCNTNTCPTGVATQDPRLSVGLHPGDKSERVWRYHKATVHSFLEVIAAAGITHPSEIKPWIILRRTSATEVRNYSELFEFVRPNSFIGNDVPKAYARPWAQAQAESWESAKPISLNKVSDENYGT